MDSSEQAVSGERVVGEDDVTRLLSTECALLLEQGFHDVAVADCGLDRMMRRLPNGLDFRVAEGGRNLSQGERMRVGLGRALLLAPRILLLDEADANLDAEAIKALDRVIAEFEGTLLMITHRSAALEACDAVWKLEKGRLNARPTPASNTHYDTERPETGVALEPAMLGRP